MIGGFDLAGRSGFWHRRRFHRQMESGVNEHIVNPMVSANLRFAADDSADRALTLCFPPYIAVRRKERRQFAGTGRE